MTEDETAGWHHHLNERGFPARPTGESDTVVVLQAELLVSDQSGWE